MIVYNDIEDFEQDWEDLPFLLLIISNENCNVCKALIKKIQDFLIMFPEVELGYIDSDQIPETVSYFNALSNPLVIFYVEGKEVFREGRFVRMNDLEKVIVRYYNLLHGELDG